MSSRTFVYPSLGRAWVKAMAAASRIGQVVWDWLGYLGQARARSELLRMAENCADSRPELAARLRAAAQRNWFGEG